MQIAQRFNTELVTDPGLVFRGTISVAPEGHATASDYTDPRLWLRVHPECPVSVRDEIIDEMGRRFLLASHELHSRTYRSFKLIPLTHQVSWQRAATTTDALTGLSKAGALAELGPIWCAIDPQSKLFFDPQLHIAPNAVNLVTGKSVALNDVVDGKMVKRLNQVLGVWLVECE